LIADPAVIAHGLPERDDHDELFEDIIINAIDVAWERMSRRDKRDDDELAEGVRRQIRRNVSEAWGKKPICYVTVSRL